ncbi:uncharacterized protein RCC_00494 [Ramularia collo-cygni]|uniref:Signal recognition particle subunit SRP14 n=1 Tax=Ramularia collo-cygni TaxID=112498 RepID=A0A2D3USC3_9PEZI|nr:uncharacterized protein RCC_00494 [Ramularia collo-cygni]CZT14517.1 uncharacterized protein RCC_00494 [Ramularia collo-cygni]
MAGHLSSDEFFAQLTTLLASAQQKGHGSIYLVQKRLTYNTPAPLPTSENPLADLNPASPLPILIRATDGKSQSQDRKEKKKKVKISTVVQPEELDGFYQKYAEVCKAGMQSLKKRDRSKRKKGKKKAAGGGEGEKK